MRIVIAGAGLVGRGLARRLVAGKHDVTVIEAERHICEQVYSQIGAHAICGSATSIATLEEAEVERADCAAAAMRDDGDNLCFALLAKHMGVRKIVARMRDPRYEEPYRLAGVTRALDSVEMYLNEFVWEIQETPIKEVASFGEAQARIVFVRVPEKSRAASRTIVQITKDDDFPQDCVIVGLFRPSTGQFIIRRGDLEVRADDRLYLGASTDGLLRAARYLGVK